MGRYLGVYLVSGRTFKCCFDNAKSKFFRAFNAINSKIGGTASEETILTLYSVESTEKFRFSVVERAFECSTTD